MCIRWTCQLMVLRATDNIYFEKNIKLHFHTSTVNIYFTFTPYLQLNCCYSCCYSYDIPAYSLTLNDLFHRGWHSFFILVFLYAIVSTYIAIQSHQLTWLHVFWHSFSRKEIVAHRGNPHRYRKPCKLYIDHLTWDGEYTTYPECSGWVATVLPI